MLAVDGRFEVCVQLPLNEEGRRDEMKRHHRLTILKEEHAKLRAMKREEWIESQRVAMVQ